MFCPTSHISNMMVHFCSISHHMAQPSLHSTNRGRDEGRQEVALGRKGPKRAKEGRQPAACSLLVSRGLGRGGQLQGLISRPRQITSQPQTLAQFCTRSVRKSFYELKAKIRGTSAASAVNKGKVESHNRRTISIGGRLPRELTL